MNDRTPEIEIHSRWRRYRELINRHLPQCDGAFVFSRLNIFYFTGTFANGVFWLPIEGEPILFCRRGAKRAEIETPLNNIVLFNSYKELNRGFLDFDTLLPSKVAAETNGLSWSLSNSLQKYLPEIEFVSSDKLLAMCRAKKSEWELELHREAGRRHNRCLVELLPPMLYEGINELQISHILSELFFSQGHNGVLRMEAFGEEVFLGHIAVGESANYPSVFNGPVGLRGVNPAAPFMGSEDVKWGLDSPLIIDNGFTLGGYQTDKTQVYWLGNKSSIPASVQGAQSLCLEMQAMIAEQLLPGKVPSSIWNQSETMALKSPWAQGFMGFGSNKVKFVGHGIGLAVDEYPVLAKGFDLPLEEGMVLAVEPKIGLPGIGMVGTENTFEVTRSGGRALTGNNYEIITL